MTTDDTLSTGAEAPRRTTPLRQATIDLGAYRRNLRVLRRLVEPAELMAVVKADGYGHGAVPLVEAAVIAGVRWFGVLELANAHVLRAAGVETSIAVFAWQFGPHESFDRAVAESIDLGVSTLPQLETVGRAARTIAVAAAPDARGGAEVRTPGLVHLNVDTGLHRDGALGDEWLPLVRRAVELRDAGLIRLRGVFSHLAEASDEEDTEAARRLAEAVASAEALGARFERQHLTASSAGMERPELRLDMVRMGSNTYGIPVTDGVSASDRGLEPVMTLTASVARVKRVPEGSGVSYDFTYRTPRETTLALVPVGYADGISRRAQHGVSVALHGRRYPIVGRVAMDQFLIDVGDDPVEVGDEVVLFGSGSRGEMTIGEFADAIGTIGEEVACGIGARVPRVYVG